MSKATKPPRADAPQLPPARKAIPVYCGDDEDDARRSYAGVVVSPEVAAYRVVKAAEAKSGLGEGLDTPALLATLHEQAEAANSGDLSRAEAMLMNQATALQSLFARLAERGMGCDAVVAFECNMRMALRAQSQCRATLETLANIKNPPTVFARQANIAHAPQQVNNGVPVPVSRAGETENSQTELSGSANELLPDARASQATRCADSSVETLGEIDRAEVRRG